MLKLNKKGFMMAELIVVSSIILVTMVGMYASFNKICSVYNTRLSYNDVTTLYKLAYYRDILIDSNKIEELKNETSLGVVKEIGSTLDDAVGFNGATEKVVMVYNNKNKINRNKFAGFKETFKDYVDYLENKIDFDEIEYMMLIERCPINIDDCSYAYLEIFE